MDRLFAMSVFNKVVEERSFVRAAKRLGISTSAASRQVAQLEQHLGVRLLQRTTRRLSATESGRTFYDRSVQLVAGIEEAEQSATAGAAMPRGTIKLTCPITFGLSYVAPAIGVFLARHRQVQFDVSLTDRPVDLVEESYDLAIRIGGLIGQNLIARKLGEIRFVACASPAYLAEHGTPRKPEDLAVHDCLSYEYLPARNQWQFRDRQGRARKVRLTGSVNANNADLLAAVAAEGIGVALAPDFVVRRELEAGRLVPLLKGFMPKPSAVYAVYPSRRYLSAKVRAFVDFLVERFARQDSRS